MTIVAAGCGFRADFGGTGYRCGAGDRCPPDYMCVDGFCVTSAPIDASTPVDARESEAGCGSLSNLRDDFGNGAIDPLWDPFSDPGATVSESGGQTRVALDTGTGDPYAGITSAALYDLHDGGIDVGVAQTGGVNTILEVRDFDGGRTQIVVEGGDLIVAVFDIPGAGQRASTPYLPADHRYWRIRGDAAGMVFWEASGNRTDWTELHHENLGLDLDNVYGIVSAGGQEATAQTALFDDVNPAEPAVGFCAGTDLVEDFAAAPLDPTWESWAESGCSLAETGGALRMDFAGAANCFSGIATRHLHDLTESEFVVDTATPSATNFISYMQVLVLGDDTTHLEIGHDGSTMYFEQSVNDINTDEADAPFDATNDRYWRIKGHAGRILIETSPDRSDWTTRLDAAAAFDYSAVHLILGAGNYGPVGSAVTVTWAGIND